MPDRIVRAGILTSDPVNTLSWAAEVFYRRLFSVVDDYGRYDARPAILRSHLYPLKVDRVSDSDVGKWLTECVNAGLVSAYQVSGRPLLEVLKFGQRVRAEKSKWPAPSTADICQQAPADAAVFVSVDVVVDDKSRKRLPTPEGVSDVVWTDFLKLRKAKRAPMTDTALAGIQREADKIGWPLQKALETCCKRGWQGFEAAWVATGKDSGITVASSPEKDPALVKLDEDKKTTKPISEEQKAALAELTNRIKVPKGAAHTGAAA